MMNNQIEMLKTWESYSDSLPVRDIPGSDITPLYKLPFCTERDDLDKQVARLEVPDATSRKSVAYIAAPSTTGKSAVVLVMYLRSLELGAPNHYTHYMYMPFANNGGKCHSRVLRGLLQGLDEDELEEAGADFMLHCFRVQLKGEYHEGEWMPPTTRKGLTKTQAEFRREVTAFMKKEEKQHTRLLLHVDEHGSMAEDFPAFRRGALSVCGENGYVARIIATYIATPALPAAGSSRICRYPIAMLFLSARAAFPEVEAALGQNPKLDGKEKRLLAALWLKLGLAFQDGSLQDLHTTNYMPGIVKDVLAELSTQGTAEDKLRKALKSVKLTQWSQPTQLPVDDAVEFLVGLADNSAMANQQKLPQVVTIGGEKLSLPLRTLLSYTSPANQSSRIRRIFKEGQTLLKDCMNGRDSGDGSLLETAYVWVLGSKWARQGGEHTLGELSFRFQVSELQDGMKSISGTTARLFSKNGEPNVQGLKNIQQSVLYHVASEGGGAGFHRGVDIWFKTGTNDLMLVDVTGSSNQKSTESKARKLAKCAKDVQACIDKQKISGFGKVRGVLLAPNCMEFVSEVEVVADMAARDLLGGLQQLLAFMEPTAYD